jgi:hypothetical protein
MPTRILSRLGAVLFLAAIASGCASRGSATVSRNPQCAVAPGSCLYEGSYESDEKDYAEQEARRLNRAQLIKMRGM